MLTPEIAPFADHHIDKLTKLHNTLLSTPDLYFPEKEERLDDLHSAINALYRFKMCMIDEHKMKERDRLAARMCRLHHTK